ncbi:urease subunit beta [Bergeyella zoohelcum]|uniref:Urease subunit beta n=1 Tax=Bergeyella zoohelcum TaxID=1015 RepID=A0A376BXS5_9FLAO|nr:urease subunit beta [Bergeyella zoohelcum]EKB60473.1 urease, beta subunit [Bergeyella zoohelcum CCUG 30536]SSZ46375.1 Urease subunit alpha [Bergeyella zoohelcum]
MNKTNKVGAKGAKTGLIPGQIILKKQDIACNIGKKTVAIEVKNVGDRPIQVGSHYHFFEVNKKLQFNREEAYGMRLNIPASTAVRFEPGESKKINLVEIGGQKIVYGHNGLVNGPLSEENKAAAVAKAKELGFL